MSITILRCSPQGIRTVNVRNRYLYLIAFSILSAFVVLFVSAYSIGKSEKKGVFSQETLEIWQTELDAQWQELENAKQKSRQQLDALTARLGIIQAHIRRLDAAGERIINTVGLDEKEFNFNQMPAIGGPEDELSNHANNTNDIFLSLNQIDGQLESKDQQLKILESLLLDKKLGAERYISGRPIRKGWMSSFYGERNDPFSGRLAWHAGVDFAGKEGSEVISTAAGIVSWVGERYGFGLLIEINHGNGIVTRYGHNKEALVKQGQMVKKGHVIGLMGNSGRSTGAHVHYEILKNGRNVNPLSYVNRRGKK